MAEENQGQARDLYIEITDKDGKSRIEERRVWDADKFMASAREQYGKEKCIVALSTREAFNEQRSKLRSKN